MSDRRFDEFLRRGGESPQFQDLPLESKFNPYHDPDDGRLTFAPGHGALAPRVAGARAPSTGKAIAVSVPWATIGVDNQTQPTSLSTSNDTNRQSLATC